jgi:hypothetical protein
MVEDVMTVLMIASERKFRRWFASGACGGER